MRLGKETNGAAVLPGAAEEHAAAAEAPHRTAARIQAAPLPARSPAQTDRPRVPAQSDGAAPVDPQNATGDMAQICCHTWTEGGGNVTSQQICRGRGRKLGESSFFF